VIFLADPDAQGRKRETPRIKHTFMAYFRMHEDMYMQNWEASTLIDLSLSGCFFFSSFPYQQGDVLDIKLQLPNSTKALTLVADVKRIQTRSANASLVGVGAQFRALDDDTKRVLEEAIAFILDGQAQTGSGGEENKRIAPRVNRNFITRFRPQTTDETQPWQFAALHNISSTGCLLSTDDPFNPGALLDIRIEFPGLESPMTFTGEVKRCLGRSGPRPSPYSVGVEFKTFEESKKEVFLQRLEFFVQKDSSR